MTTADRRLFPPEGVVWTTCPLCGQTSQRPIAQQLNFLHWCDLVNEQITISTRLITGHTPGLEELGYMVWLTRHAPQGDDHARMDHDHAAAGHDEPGVQRASGVPDDGHRAGLARDYLSDRPDRDGHPGQPAPDPANPTDSNRVDS